MLSIKVRSWIIEGPNLRIFLDMTIVPERASDLRILGAS